MPAFLKLVLPATLLEADVTQVLQGNMAFDQPQLIQLVKEAKLPPEDKWRLVKLVKRHFGDAAVVLEKVDAENAVATLQYYFRQTGECADSIASLTAACCMRFWLAQHSTVKSSCVPTVATPGFARP